MIASRLNTYEQLMTDITSLSQSLHLTEQIITAIIQSTNSQLLAPLVDFAERDRLIKLHLLVDAIKRKLDDNSSAFSICLYTAPELALGKELKKRGPELDKLLNTKFVKQAELIFAKYQELYPLVIDEQQLQDDIAFLEESLHLGKQITAAIIQSTNHQLLIPLVGLAERDRLIKLHLLVNAIKHKLGDNSSAFSSCLYTAPELALGKELKKRGPELDKLLNTKFVEQAELIFTKYQELYPLVIDEQQLQDDIALLEESLHLGKQITAAIIQSTNHQLSLRAMESRRRGRVVPGSLRAGCFSAGKI